MYLPSHPQLKKKQKWEAGFCLTVQHQWSGDHWCWMIRGVLHKWELYSTLNTPGTLNKAIWISQIKVEALSMKKLISKLDLRYVSYPNRPHQIHLSLYWHINHALQYIKVLSCCTERYGPVHALVSLMFLQSAQTSTYWTFF